MGRQGIMVKFRFDSKATELMIREFVILGLPLVDAIEAVEEGFTQAGIERGDSPDRIEMVSEELTQLYYKLLDDLEASK